MKITTLAAVFSLAAGSNAGADSISRALGQALGTPAAQYFQTRASCLQELSRAIDHAERGGETADILAAEISERGNQAGAQEAIAALSAQTAASEAYVSALMTFCQSYD